MSSFKVNYYSPNDTNYIATIDVNSINCQPGISDSQCGSDITAARSLNTQLANKIQKANNKNATSLGLYTDSSIFYTMQYIQLWNMAGGIALSGSLIYYLVYVKK